MKLKPLIYSMMLLVGAGSLTGCLNSSSNNTEKSQDQQQNQSLSYAISLSGAIGKAVINAETQDGVAITQTQLTDENGRVTLSLPQAYQNTPFVIRMQGGYISETGHDLSGIELRFPVENAASAASIDLTSIFFKDYTDNNWHSGYVLASLLHVLKVTSNPVEQLIQAVTDDDLLAAIASLKANYFNKPNIFSQLELVEKLASLNDKTPDNIKKTALKLGLQYYLEERLSEPVLSDEQAINLTKLAQSILVANNGRTLQPESPALLNLARALASQGVLTLDALDDASYTPDISTFNIPALASTRLVDPVQPLASSELLGMDEVKRRAYFLSTPLSPYNMLNAWTADVLDDSLLDEAQRAIAVGLASGGLIDEAIQIVNSRLYKPTHKAQALRRVGNVIGQQDEKPKAIELLDAALEIYTNDLRGTKGIANLDADDASFYQTLFSNYLALGEQDKADAALATLNEFKQQYGNQPYDTPWGRILTGTWRIAQAAVEEAEQKGLTPEAVQQAKYSVDLHKEFTDLTGVWNDANGNPRDRTCYSVKTMNVERNANFYARLGLEEQTKAGIAEFERLARESCNYISHGANLRNIASAYAAFNLSADYRDFVESLSFTFDPNASRAAENKQRALSTITFAEQVDTIINAPTTENVIAAIAAVAPDSESDLNKRLEQLTYLGQNKLTAYLGLSLIRAEQPIAARQVLDAAWELAVSDDYLATYKNDPVRLIHWGCSKVADLYYDLGDLDTAQSKMQTCAIKVEAKLTDQTTSEKTATRMHLANGFQRLNKYEEALEQAEAHYALSSLRDSTSDKISHKHGSAKLFNSIERADRSLVALNSALLDINGLSASTDVERKAKIEAFRAQSNGRHDVIQSLRSLPNVAQLSGADRSTINQQRVKMKEVVDVAMSIVKQLTNPTDLANAAHLQQQELFKAGYLDDAYNIARSHSQEAVRIEALKRLATSVLLGQYDAFPSTDVARFDFDGDGQPDFFSPLATLEQIQASGLTLDDDIDGDGVFDTQDTTPYSPNI
ncbi:hypothetical protein P8S54_03880 [Thiomicrospira sp. R3]|uniref:hypothetical protein n=1 Tax=Thiomicrospira sp. R3 TaxID=3035472 RepID=UPI00259B9BC0|nr:hypothetical protein [Thiomicrospira sp. R3]WFE69446.1 hypothetical protein P8S54_03880 [Thiomicrospira sp. R3]